MTPPGPEAYVPMTRDQLVQVLEDMLDVVRDGDSFEGSIEYLMPEPEDFDKGVEFRVMAAYRVGNSMGQGGMRLIRGDLPPRGGGAGQQSAEPEPR